jgi:hypothetical protein
LAKWADYLISAVSYNKDHTRIENVRQHLDTGDNVGDGFSVSRYTVVANILGNRSYCTIRKGSDGKWYKGDNVIMYSLDGSYFIRTDGNKTKSDNLGELPEF